MKITTHTDDAGYVHLIFHADKARYAVTATRRFYWAPMFAVQTDLPGIIVKNFNWLGFLVSKKKRISACTYAEITSAAESVIRECRTVIDRSSNPEVKIEFQKEAADAYHRWIKDAKANPGGSDSERLRKLAGIQDESSISD